DDLSISFREMRSRSQRDSYAMLCFFAHSASTAVYTLSLHDALPILGIEPTWPCGRKILSLLRLPGSATRAGGAPPFMGHASGPTDRKSTRLNSSHVKISYAVFCSKKKRTTR